MAIGPNPRYIEELCIGGGYGEPADGGASLEKTGDIATDGNITLKGVLAAGSSPQALTDTDGLLDGARIQAGTVDADKLDESGDYVVHGLEVSGAASLCGLEVLDSSDLGSELVVNGDMELDSNWSNKGSPSTNEQSTEPVHGGTYARKIVASGAAGMEQSLGTLRSGDTYLLTLWAYCVSGALRARLQGTSTWWLLGNEDLVSELNTWVQHTLVLTIPATEPVSVQLVSGISSATFYVDEVSIKRVGGDAAVRGHLEARQGATLGGDAVVEGALDVQGGDLEAGEDGLTRGVVSLWDGAGGNAPGCVTLYSANGTPWHLFVEDDGTVKIHSTLPTQNADGSVVGSQS